MTSSAAVHDWPVAAAHPWRMEHAAPSTTLSLPEDLRAALDRVERALRSMFAGDPEPYAALWPREGADVTLFGAWGPIEHGHQVVTTTFQWVGSRFSDGAMSCRYDVVAASGDLAYTVGFESGEVRVDGGPIAPMQLRVTHVLRRIDGEWWLVHRHADFPPADQRDPDRRRRHEDTSRADAPQEARGG
jgi:ketosteroid isomerase-like protein